MLPLQSPGGHILNATQSDHLAHSVKFPSIPKPTISINFSYNIYYVQCRSEYNDVDTMDINTHSDFSKT